MRPLGTQLSSRLLLKKKISKTRWFSVLLLTAVRLWAQPPAGEQPKGSLFFPLLSSQRAPRPALARLHVFCAHQPCAPCAPLSPFVRFLSFFLFSSAPKARVLLLFFLRRGRFLKIIFSAPSARVVFQNCLFGAFGASVFSKQFSSAPWARVAAPIARARTSPRRSPRAAAAAGRPRRGR